VRLEPVARDARVTGIGRVGGGGGVQGAYCSDRALIKSAVGADVILRSAGPDRRATLGARFLLSG
jgi:hypothetical protein